MRAASNHKKEKKYSRRKTSEKRTTNKQTEQKRREASWGGKKIGSETRCTLALNWYQRRERPESFSMAALMQTESTCTIFHLYSFAIVRKVILRMNILIIIILLDPLSLFLARSVLACLGKKENCTVFSFFCFRCLLGGGQFLLLNYLPLERKDKELLAIYECNREWLRRPIS